jgi:hypothetical protein
VGSVGQPRDGDPRGRWALWDSAQRTVEFRQVSYDVEAAAQAILAAGLAPMNAIRLFAEEEELLDQLTNSRIGLMPGSTRKCGRPLESSTVAEARSIPML